MKLQELLNRHEHNLKGIGRARLIENRSILLLDTDESMSLSDLLFGTPFLSLLERKKCEGYLYWIKQDDQGKVKNIYYDERYHKINLALLNTDEERIEYIEKFTI